MAQFHHEARSGASFGNSILGLLCLALPLGLVVGYAAIFFLLLIDGVMWLGYTHHSQYPNGHDSVAEKGVGDYSQVLIALAIGGAGCGLLTHYVMPKGTNVGFVGVLEAVRHRNGIISAREGLGVSLISAISIGVGASVGRYGPAVHIGSALGSWLGESLRLNRESVVILLAAGSSAAIASSFHAPFAGVIFAHEVILRHYAIGAFAPVTTAAIVGMLVGEHHNNGRSVFWYDIDAVSLHQADFVVSLFVGVFAAGISLIFMKTLPKVQVLMAKCPIDTRLKPVLGAVVLTPIIWFQPQVMGLGAWAIKQSFHGGISIGTLLPLLFIKMGATILSLGLGFNGGVFAPVVFIGAMLGSICAKAASHVGFSTAPDALFAFSGMGAMVASIFGAPVFAVIVVLEMTASFPATTFVLTSVTAAYLVSHEVFSASLFQFQLEQSAKASGRDDVWHSQVKSLEGIGAEGLRDITVDSGGAPPLDAGRGSALYEETCEESNAISSEL